MRALFKTGIAAIAVTIISMVGYGPVLGYGGDPCKTPVSGNLYVSIYEGNEAYSPNIQLDLHGGNAVFMMVGNDFNFTGGRIEPYKRFKEWTVAPGSGNRTVWVKYYNQCLLPTVGYAYSFKLVAPQYPGGRGRILGPRSAQTDELIASLKYGTTSEDVKKLQMLLMAGNFMPAGFTTPTSYYGAITRNAANKYIAKLNVTKTDLNLLVSKLKSGDFSADVSRLQKALRDLRYYNVGDIPLTGYYGTATTNAVKAYLKK